MHPIRTAIVTISDRAFSGERADASGPAMAEVLRAAGLDVVDPVVVPDEVLAIRQAIRDALDSGARVVCCTGGTGISPRDVTNEAVAGLLDIRLVGIESALRQRGVEEGAPGALLSRPLAGIISDARALVIAGPGSVNAARDTAEIAAQLAEHTIAQLDGNVRVGHDRSHDHAHEEHSE